MPQGFRGAPATCIDDFISAASPIWLSRQLFVWLECVFVVVLDDKLCDYRLLTYVIRVYLSIGLGEARENPSAQE